ncbi:hypothetical protein HMI54_005073 [Coelomomyces lativittatus]|nr:hypothetical protein HMI54_005073 [Coelomomyces lativittatus]
MTPPGSWLPKGFLKSLSTTILTTPTLSTVFFLRPLPPSLPSSSSSSSSSSSCPPSPLTYVVALLARFLSKYFPVHAPRVVLEHPPTTYVRSFGHFFFCCCCSWNRG